jgi:predicted permease
VILNGEQVTPVAVLDDHFWFANSQIELWRPLRFSGAQLADDKEGTLTVIGRLRKSATLDQARREADQWLARARLSGERQKSGIGLELLAHTVNRQLKSTITMLAWSVGLLLLVAVANLTGLLLARGLPRMKDYALRIALGASSSRLGMQVLSETLVLGAFGCALGVGLAWMGSRVILSVIPENYRDAIAGVSKVGITFDVVFFSMALMLVSMCVACMLPAFRAARADMQAVLRSNGRGVTRRSRHLEIIVAFQVAISLLLLVTTGVLLKNLIRLKSVNVGFEENVLTMRLFLSTKYNDSERLGRYQHDIVDQVTTIPGIQAAAFISYLPLAGTGSTPFHVVGTEDQGSANMLVVSPGAFRTLRIPVKWGRDFTEMDAASSAPVIIVSASVAKRCCSEEALGRYIVLPTVDKTPWQIVGVVGDVRARTSGKTIPFVYFPYRQKVAGTILLVRAAGKSTTYASAVMRRVRAVDREQPMRWIDTLAHFEAEGLWQQRMSAAIVTALAVMALVLSIVGIYGAMTSYVAQRTSEFGVRMALGASPRDIGLLVVKRALVITGVGLAAGMAALLPLDTIARHVLFEARLMDITVLAGSATVFLLLVMVAIYLPWRRAATVDPMTCLRIE